MIVLFLRIRAGVNKKERIGDMPFSDKQKSDKENNHISRLSFWLFVAALTMVILLIVLLATADNAGISQKRTKEGFTQITEYDCVEEKDTAAPIGIRKEYIFTLPEGIPTDCTLAFYTVHQYVQVWLGGEKVYQLLPPKHTRLSKTVGSNWVMIPIYREDAGKEIRVEITPVYESFRKRKVDFLMGSELAIFRDRLRKDLPQLILGIMAVFVGVVFLCVSGYDIKKKKRGKHFFALGTFSIMMGLWRLTDTRFTPFILEDKPVMLFYISVTMLSLGMIPIMKWIEGYFTRKSRRVLEGYCVIAATVSLLQLLLQFLGILDIRETLTVTHMVIGAGVILAMGIVLYEGKKYKEKPRIPLGNKLPYICFAGVIADVIAFYFKGNSSGLVFTLLAFLFYIVFMGIATMNNYSEQELILAEKERQLAEKNRELAENERKLTERRIASMMSQIKSHFIFNVLTTISSYCKTDPKKADTALVRFSRYLRKNIRMIEEEGLIDFSVELEQLEDYIALEQMRFGDRIQFEKEIETTSFQLPPLTIQPLVENAIKHGLIKPGKSGTIRLHTKRGKDYVEIIVADDGVGFVPEEGEKDDSVGIRNVRYRLEYMTGGSLRVESTAGEGTTATIKIPTGEEER